MKKIVLSVFVLAVCLGVTAQKTPKTPAKTVTVKTTTPVKLSSTTMISDVQIKSLLDSFSYMAGYNVATNMLQQGITEVNVALMKKGIEDYFANRTPLLVPQEGNKSLQRQLDVFAQKKAVKDKIKSDEKKAEGQAFLDNNKKRKEVTTLPDGLQYEVIKEGDAVAHMPKARDTVVVNYIGTLIDGREFDNSYKRGQPAIFPVGNVIKGWIEALQLMRVGAHWKIYIPNELAYGDNPPPGSGIEPGAPLIFDLLLEGIKPVITQ